MNASRVRIRPGPVAHGTIPGMQAGRHASPTASRCR